MTLALLESFDMTTLAALPQKGWVTSQGTTSNGLSVVSGRNSQGVGLNFTVDIGTPPTLFRQVLSANEHVTFTLGFAFNTSVFGTSSGICYLTSDEGTTQHVYLYIGPGGQLHVAAGPGLPRLGSSSVLISLNTWNYIELLATLSSTVGVIQVSVNDAMVIGLTGQNTQNGGTKTLFDSFIFNPRGVGAYNGGNFIIDDLYLTTGAGSVNTGMLGDLSVLVMRPNANGDLSQLVNSAGTSVNNFSYVNSVLTQTTNFVQSSVAGNEDTYGMSAMPAGTVFGVQTVMLAEKSNTGLRTLTPVMRESGTDYLGVAGVLSTSPQYQQQIFESNPSTSAPWLVTGLNSTQFGAKVG